MSTSTRLLRRPEVEHDTGLARSTLYDAIRAGTFPKPVPLTTSARIVAWRSDEVEAWIQARIAARDAQPSSRPDVQSDAGGAA